MPTAAQHTYTVDRLDPYMNPEEAKLINVGLAQGTYAKGTVLGELTATPGRYTPYATGNVDGSETAKVILQYACEVDASNNITIADEWGSTRKAAPAYVSGTFRSQDLTGLDAAGLTEMGGKLVQGTVSNGIVRIG